MRTLVGMGMCGPHNFCSFPFQVEFANLLVLNKVDLVTPEQANQLEALLKKLNVKAKVCGGEGISDRSHEVEDLVVALSVVSLVI